MNSNAKQLRIALQVLLGLFIVLFLTQLRILSSSVRLTEEEWQTVTVTPPDTPPHQGQASIDIALKMYNIRVPKNAMHPRYNPQLSDRGLATGKGWSRKIQIEIGPSAFSSWGMLASTLGHELEIHCQQNFILVNLMDLLGLHGSLWAERQAYIYELKNAKRFGLSPYQRELIAGTMDFYYNVDTENRNPSHHLGHRLGRWLAR